MQYFKYITGFLLIALLQPVIQSQAQQQRPSIINLRSYTFDPVVDTLSLPDSLRIQETVSDSIYRLIQFTRSLTRNDFKLLKESYGLKLDRYIPNYSYLERLSASDISRLELLDFFRWSGLYEPAFKISPDIGARSFITTDRSGTSGRLLYVQLFPEADLNAIADQVRDAGFEVLNVYDDTEFGGMKRLRIRATSSALLSQLASLDSVEWIEEQGELTIDNGTTSAVIQSNTATGTPIYAQGIRGENQIVGLIDATLDMNHCFFNDAVNPIGPAHRKVVGYRQDNPATFTGPAGCIAGHGTHTGGTIAGASGTNANNGIAFNARLTYGDLSDLGSTRTFLEYLNAARNDGAFLHSNSWSDKSTTAYTIDSQDLDVFTWNNEDQLVIVSSGNNIDTDGDTVIDAPSPTRPPWTSKNGLAVAASAQAPNQANVSTGGIGPTFDGRRKPEIYAPGTNTNSAQAGTNCGLQTCSGSSMATPAIAGAAALLRQYFTEGWYPSGTQQPHNAFTPTGALLKATLLNSTRDMNGNDAFGSGVPLNGYPTNLEGWGRLVLDDAMFFAGDARNLTAWDVRHSSGLFTGESHTYNVEVTNAAQALKITLVWMEPPATSANFGAPVTNDLDLVVTAPDGITTYLGNSFAGTQSTTGGTTDVVNNVEMVLRTTPQVGTYSIAVFGTAVNEGLPGQGYALVATGDFPDPPVPTGPQNTLVVRAGLSDLSAGALPSETLVQNQMTNAANYISEVSYGQVTINAQPAEVTLPQPSTYYFNPARSVLIEMTEDVIAELLAANPNTFDQGTPDLTDDIDRMVIVLNDPDFTDDWATTGPWPYDLPGDLTRRISVSIQSIYNDPEPRFSHGLAHQFGLQDLYAHPNVVFAQPHVDNWDLMASRQSLKGLMAWSKEQATWITGHGSTIEYIPRPAVGSPVNSTIGLNFVSSTATNRKAIALGLTEGAANIEDEDVFYVIEARSNVASTVDDNLPEEGVLLYRVNENIPQGQGPVLINDDEVATAHLDDAALELGDNKTTPEGLDITIQAGTGGADRNILLSYDPPATDNDVSMTVGNPAWTSPDIWIDSPKDGFDADNGIVPADRGDNPVLGVVNRIYFRVTNSGPSPARDFMIFVRVSEPYHTVGGAADFNVFVGQRFVSALGIPGDGGDEGVLVDYIEWTPVADGDPHSCVHIEIPNVFNDVNEHNNRAQQNLRVVTSTTASPYESVTYNFGFSNPEDNQELFYFRAEDIPTGWTASLNPKSVRLNAGQRIEASLTLQPPDDAPVCSNHKVSVTSWSPRGDTMIPIGGGTVQTNLRNRTDIDITTETIRCQAQDPVFKRGPDGQTNVVVARENPFGSVARGYNPASCRVIETRGCTNPPQPNEEIVLRYDTPDGYPIYRTVTTDALGCYVDNYTVAEGGEWTVTAEFPGDDCDGPAEATSVTAVAIASTGDQDGDGVPDADEPQGDHDGDGLLGIFDNDSDNDGIPDGLETPGDADQDAHDNIVDQDSDGDGVIDGKDRRPYGDNGLVLPDRFRFSAHVGSVHPIGDLNEVADANVHIRLDVEYLLNDRLRLLLFGGFSQFTQEISTGVEHPYWFNLSANVRALFPTPSGTHLFLQAGPGRYWPKTGSPDLGFNIGTGIQLPIGGGRHLEFGMDYHNISTDEATRFLSAQLGIIFR